VAKDITSAILKQQAKHGVPAQYWNKAEQERQLVAVFDKWSKDGRVWSAASSKVTASSHSWNRRSLKSRNKGS
jgi:hypothetical protein